MRYLSRDPFARLDFVRKSVHLGELTGPTCAWCGSPGRHISGFERVLYRYGYEDDNCHVYLSEKLFCCKSCYECYSIT